MTGRTSVNGTRLLVVVLLALVVVDLSWTAAVNHRVAAAERDVDALERDQDVLAAHYGANGSPNGPTAATVSLYAYEKRTGDAVAVPARVATVPADGLYVDVGEVAHTAAVQRAIERAWTVASASDGDVGPQYRGATVTVDAPASWDTVGGGSAAVSLATGFAATSPCASVNRSVAATGGLTADGELVRVERVREKALAARRRGVDVFVVPPGQRVAVEGIDVVEAATFEAVSDLALEVRDSCADAGPQ